MRRRIAVAGILLVLVALLIALWMKRSDDEVGSGAAGGRGGSAATTASGSGRGASSKGPLVAAVLSGRVTRRADGTGIAGAVVSLARAEIMQMLMSEGQASVVVVTNAK